MRLTRVFCFIALFYSALNITSAWAETFPLPAPGDHLIGHIQYTNVSLDSAPARVAQQYDVGLNAIMAANPGTGEMAFSDSFVKIPSAFLLPPGEHRGIVINLPEMRMYVYHDNSVMTFPVGIGRVGKTIPVTTTAITRKVVNPTWTPTPAIREWNREQGIDLPKDMGPGPDNPLGPYAIYLRVPTYLIHSTIFPESIGRRASFGCIRMNEGDIEQFFPVVAPGTPVAIIDQPTKLGWRNQRLLIEVHRPLEEGNKTTSSLDGMVNEVENTLPPSGVTLVNWQLVAYLAENPDGVPHEIGVKVK